VLEKGMRGERERDVVEIPKGKVGKGIAKEMRT
jgi:hypothetical protein